MYKDTLRQAIGIGEPMIERCLKMPFLAELRALGADMKVKSNILEILAGLRNQDHESRLRFLVEKVKNELQFLNCVTSQRVCVSASQ